VGFIECDGCKKVGCAVCVTETKRKGKEAQDM
jgi:hypothetical protein